MNFLLTIAVTVVCAAPPTPAPAVASDPKAADALFSQARALIKAGKSIEACPLLEKSHLLDPALGTLLNLGDCYESTGRTVQAFLSFNEAAAWATRNHEAGRAEIARARAASLKTRLSWLALSTVAPAPGLTVSVNDFLIELGAAPQSVPVDAGKLRIVASAPDRDPWMTTVMVAAHQTLAIAVPSLAPASELKRPDDLRQFESSLSVVPLVAMEGTLSTPAPRRAAGITRSAFPTKTTAVGLLSGGAAVAVAGVAGLAWSLTTYERFQKQQPGQAGYGSPTVTRSDLATVRWVYPAAWVAAGVGVAAAAAGAVLYLKETHTSFALVPTASGLGLAASGSF